LENESRDNTQRQRSALEGGGAAEQIIADLPDQILRGTLPQGSKLPNERALAERYGVSGPTIREAVRGLAAIKLVGPLITAENSKSRDHVHHACRCLRGSR
jgi:DNA-binding GntR family transcriptional regulator